MMNSFRIRFLAGILLYFTPLFPIFAAESTNQVVSLQMKTSEEKTENGFIMNLFIKNSGDQDLPLTMLDLILKGIKPQEMLSGKLQLGLSHGMEVKVPIHFIKETPIHGEFFGISFPLFVQSMEEIRSVELVSTNYHFELNLKRDVKESSNPILP